MQQVAAGVRWCTPRWLPIFLSFMTILLACCRARGWHAGCFITLQNARRARVKEGLSMNLRVTGGLIVYVASIAILFFACLHDLNTQVRNSHLQDVGTVANQQSVVDQY
jgi:hypothetical protein